MNEKITKALGEELTKTVEEALKKAGLEIGVTNDGTLVPADKHDEKKAELKAAATAKEAAEKELERVNGELKTLKEKPDTSAAVKADLEKLQGEYTTYKTTAEKTLANVKKSAALERALVAAKANPDAVEYLITLFDAEKIELDDKGNVAKFDEHLKPVLESKKSLFATETLAGQGIPDPARKETPDGWAAKLDAAKKANNNLEIIKVKQAALSEGVVLN